uniref:DUF2982 domain-containing protein n=1 Tax=Thaumasiovibrio occultus TaxID=1891184 RepID=UPI000B35EBE9|nr:DUF2982 domain-containing protein [Thaumasiovibrio occultus]
METRHIAIHPPTSHSFFALAGVGCLILLAVGLVFANIKPAWTIPVMVTTSLILAWFYWHLRQPAISLSLTPMHLQLHHRVGGWSVRWHSLITIEQLQLERDGWYEPIPWVGLKLKSYDDILCRISPRVVSQILIEQRILLIMAHRRGAKGSVAIEDMLFDDTPYIDHHGVRYTGLMAMFANRMRYNRELLGSDLMISEDRLGMESSRFVGLARRYMMAAPSDDH